MIHLKYKQDFKNEIKIFKEFTKTKTTSQNQQKSNNSQKGNYTSQCKAKSC